MSLRANSNLWTSIFTDSQSSRIYELFTVYACRYPLLPKTMAAEISVFPGNDDHTLGARTGALICGLLYSNAVDTYLYKHVYTYLPRMLRWYLLCFQVPDAG